MFLGKESAAPGPTEYCLVLLFEVAVLEDVRGGADEAKANIFVTGIAEREQSSLEHYDFMCAAVVASMDDLVNAGFADRLAGAELGAVRPRTMAVITLGRAVNGADFVPGRKGTSCNFCGSQHRFSARFYPRRYHLQHKCMERRMRIQTTSALSTMRLRVR